MVAMCSNSGEEALQSNLYLLFRGSIPAFRHFCEIHFTNSSGTIGGLQRVVHNKANGIAEG